jgi:hypothetical protein
VRKGNECFAVAAVAAGCEGNDVLDIGVDT